MWVAAVMEVSFLTFKPGKGFTLQASLSVPVGVVRLAEDYSAREGDLSLEAYEAMAHLTYQGFQHFFKRSRHRRKSPGKTAGANRGDERHGNDG